MIDVPAVFVAGTLVAHRLDNLMPEHSFPWAQMHCLRMPDDCSSYFDFDVASVEHSTRNRRYRVDTYSSQSYCTFDNYPDLFDRWNIETIVEAIQIAAAAAYMRLFEYLFSLQCCVLATGVLRRVEFPALCYSSLICSF